MFSFTRCAVEGCRNYAVHLATTCTEHLPDPDSYHAAVRELLVRESNLVNLHLSGIRVSDIDLSGKNFSFCTMSSSVFERVRFTGAVMRYVFFDFSRFVDCDLSNADLRETVFAGATIEQCRFVNSEITRCNFIGAVVKSVAFDDSDLYLSRFSGSHLDNVQFIDCNLKRTHYTKSILKNVNFRSSNIEEAYLEGAMQVQ